jgi:hypothetical protein
MKISFDINNAENLTNLIIKKYGVPIDTSFALLMKVFSRE